MTILVIEDNENDAALLLLELRRIGFTGQVQVLTRAENAILYLQALPPYANREKYPFPNLIVLDLSLPGMTGADFLKWLQANPIPATPLVAVLTGSPFLEPLREAYALGARRFFLKPIRRRQLEQLVGLVAPVPEELPFTPTAGAPDLPLGSPSAEPALQ